MTYMKKNLHFFNLKKNALRTDGRTDGRTDRPTDRPSYRDARTHLKTIRKKSTAGQGNCWPFDASGLLVFLSCHMGSDVKDGLGKQWVCDAWFAFTQKLFLGTAKRLCGLVKAKGSCIRLCLEIKRRPEASRGEQTLGTCSVYSRANGIADHYWYRAVFLNT